MKIAPVVLCFYPGTLFAMTGFMLMAFIFILTQILPCVRTWCESKKLTIIEQFIKWVGILPVLKFF